MKIKNLISAALAAAICVTSSAPSANSRTFAFDMELNAEPVFTAEGKSSFGDTDGNGAVDASDASLVLSDYSLTSTGGTSMFNATQKLNADINADGSIDASDASYILSYYAYISTGGKLTLTEFLKPQQPVVTTTTAPVTTTTATTTKPVTTTTKPITTTAKPTTTTVAPKPTTTVPPVTTTVAPKPTTTVPPVTTTTAKPTTTTAKPTTTTTKPTTTVPPATTTEANAKVSDIRITRNEMVLNVGEGDLSAYVTMLPTNAGNKAEMWSSSDESIAIVDNEGWVVGIGEGECFITVTSVDNPAVYAKIKVTVNDTKSVKSIRLSRTAMTMQAGTGELAARVTMLPETALNKKEIWTSSQPDVATVDSEGWVTALKPGNTIISVQSVDNPSVYGMVLVTVTAEQVTSTSATTASATTAATTTTTTTVPPVVTTTAPFVDVQEVKFGDSEVTLKAGTSYTPILAIAPENATNKTLVWTSSNNSIATVSSNGVITAVNEGICYITASSASNPAVRAVAIINVTNNTSTGTVTEIKLSKYEMQLTVGSTDLSWVTMLPADAPNKDEFWTTSDPAIATVDEYGWVKGVSTGECIVTVYSVDNHNVKAEIKVKVVSGPVETPKYTFSQIAPGKSTDKEIAFLTPFPENADGLFIFDYFITDANGNKRLTTTYVMDSADTENVITMLTADTNHFTAELYVTNLNTSKRAKIGSYNFVINPRNAQTEEEAIEYAFAAVGGLK